MTDTPSDEHYYSSGKVAKMFDVKTATIGDWCLEGKFPKAFKLNDRWKIPHSDVLALAEKRHGSVNENL